MKRPASLSTRRRGYPSLSPSALVALLAITDQRSVEAEFPFSRGGNASDPYAYENYMFITDADDPAQYPPNDLGGDDWKYSSKKACDL